MKRKLNIALVTAASLAFTGAAHAGSSKAFDQMMDTCIQHFVAANLADFQGKVTVQKADSASHGPLVAGSSSYRITIAAVGRPGGAPLATATCQMARDGSVISMKTMPLAALKKVSGAKSMVVAKN